MVPDLAGQSRSAIVASMGPRSDNRGYGRPAPRAVVPTAASMGPRSDNRGYVASQVTARSTCAASMGPRSDNRGYGLRLAYLVLAGSMASMGPRSDNRGYGGDRPALLHRGT